MFHEFPDADSCANAQAEATCRLLHKPLAAGNGGSSNANGGGSGGGGGGATLAVSGGRSPVPFFEQLAKAKLDWQQVYITLVDERLVPPSHKHSNERLVREHLLQDRAAAANFRGLARVDKSETAQVERANRDPRKLDVVVLGMGKDGHTASLFAAAPEYPSATDLANEARYCVIHPPTPPVDPPHPRISLTLVALIAADRLLLAISGAAKREVFERAARQPRTDLPISLLLAHTQVKGNLDVYWHP